MEGEAVEVTAYLVAMEEAQKHIEAPRCCSPIVDRRIMALYCRLRRPYLGTDISGVFQHFVASALDCKAQWS